MTCMMLVCFRISGNCSHVGALLLAIEFFHRTKDQVECFNLAHPKALHVYSNFEDQTNYL